MKPLTEAAIGAITILGAVLAAAGAEPPVLPWQREVPLREAAQSVTLECTLHPTNPLPDSGGFGAGGGMTINNLKMWKFLDEHLRN